jgi:hypothetical protein
MGLNMKLLAHFLACMATLFVTMSQASESITDVVCSYAPSQNAAINRITAGVGGAGAGVAAILQAAGMSAVVHSSGAYILTSSGGYVAGTMGGAVLAPVLITASVLVGGTAVLVELTCSPKNHPDAMNAVTKFSKKFNEAMIATNVKAIDVRDRAGETIHKANGKAIDMRDGANDKAIEFRDSASRLYAKGKAKLSD